MKLDKVEQALGAILDMTPGERIELRMECGHVECLNRAATYIIEVLQSMNNTNYTLWWNGHVIIVEMEVYLVSPN